MTRTQAERTSAKLGLFYTSIPKKSVSHAEQLFCCVCVCMRAKKTRNQKYYSIHLIHVIFLRKLT